MRTINHHRRLTMPSHLNVIGYIDDKFGELKLDGNHKNAKICCPFCSDIRYRMGILIDSGVAHCFNCGWAGNFIKFVMEFEGLDSYSDVYNNVKQYHKQGEKKFNIEHIDPNILQTFVNGNKKSMLYPEGFERIDTNSSNAFWPQKYVEGRGFSVSYAAQFGIGYSTHYKYRETIIIPTFHKGELAYYITRYYGKDSKKKVLRSNQAAYPNAMFNFNMACNFDCIYITEGWADAMSLGYNAVSLSGKSINDSQVAQLVILHKPLIVILDPEAIMDALVLSDKLQQHSDDVWIVGLESGDPNDLFRRGNLVEEIQKGISKYKTNIFLKK